MVFETDLSWTTTRINTRRELRPAIVVADLLKFDCVLGSLQSERYRLSYSDSWLREYGVRPSLGTKSHHRHSKTYLKESSSTAKVSTDLEEYSWFLITLGL
jgi:hypothetical protein